MIDLYCDRPMEEGTLIMGSSVKLSPKRKVVVKQHGALVQSGTVLRSLDEVLVEVEPPSTQAVLEIRGGNGDIAFVNGGCEGSRVLKLGTLLPARDVADGASSPFSIVVGWASSYNSGVFVSEPFDLVYQPVSSEL